MGLAQAPEFGAEPAPTDRGTKRHEKLASSMRQRGQRSGSSRRTRCNSPPGHQSVTRALHVAPDNQYGTVLSFSVKSHPGFQAGNFLHALASHGQATP